jgi:DNA transformation protein
MRNAKVRRRIAAGKLKLRIRDLRNLGPRSEQLLAQVGIRSADGLRRRGAVEAYLALRRIGATHSLNMLWAMAGALDPWPEGQDWREVAAGDQRLPLLLAVDGPGAAAESASGRRRVRTAVGRGASVGSTDAAAALGAWAPGLPFAVDSPHPPAGAAASPKAASPKAKSRPKAGS